MLTNCSCSGSYATRARAPRRAPWPRRRGAGSRRRGGSRAPGGPLHFLPKFYDDKWQVSWIWSGAKECKSCRSRKMLKNETPLAIGGVNTEEKGPMSIYVTGFTSTRGRSRGPGRPLLSCAEQRDWPSETNNRTVASHNLHESDLLTTWQKEF